MQITEKELIQLLKDADDAYYNVGNSQLTDEEYDALKEEAQEKCRSE